VIKRVRLELAAAAVAGFVAAFVVAAGCSKKSSSKSGGAAAPASPTLTVTVTGAGSVASSPAAITCPGTCSGAFVAGSTVTLTETPSSGLSFIGWTGACGGTGSTCGVFMQANASVGASFAILRTLTVSITGSGTVTSSPAGINCVDNSGACSAQFADGSTVTLTATPTIFWFLSDWGLTCAGSGDCGVSMSADTSVTANFSGT